MCNMHVHTKLSKFHAKTKYMLKKRDYIKKKLINSLINNRLSF